MVNLLGLASFGAFANVFILGVILALAVVLVRWVIGMFGLPAQVFQIVVVLVGLLALLVFLRALLPLLGFNI